MALKFGIFDTFSHAEGEMRRAADLYGEHLDDARLADRLGYEYFFFIEHQNAGFPCVSAPTVYLSALAVATQRIRIGAMVFQMPLLVFFLSKFGIVSARFLLKHFKYAVLIIFIVAAVITPSADMMTQLVFAAPMLGLYIVSIGVAALFGKRKPVEV